MSTDNFAEKLERFRSMPEYGSQFHPPYATRSTIGLSTETIEAERKETLAHDEANFAEWLFNAAQNVIEKWLRQNLQNPIGIFNLDRFREQITSKSLWILHLLVEEIQNDEIERIEECENLLKKLRDEVMNDPNWMWNKSYFLQRAGISEGFTICDREKWNATLDNEFTILKEQKAWFGEVLKILQETIIEKESHEPEVKPKEEILKQICAKAEKPVSKINEIQKLPSAQSLNLNGFTFDLAKKYMEAQAELNALRVEFNNACGDRKLFSDFGKDVPTFPVVKGAGWSDEAETRSRIVDFYNKEIARRK